MGKNLNLEFFAEYKRLDAALKDIYPNSEKSGVTSYIDEMRRSPSDCKELLGELVRLRHIRNDLAHNPDSFDSTLCTKRDIEFLKHFKVLLLNRRDPLSRLNKRSISRRRGRKQNRYDRIILFISAVLIVMGIIIYFFSSFQH